MRMRALRASLLLGIALELAAPPMARATPPPPCVLRVPQVPFISTALQDSLNIWDGGINVLADQMNWPFFQSSVSSTQDFTLLMEDGMQAPGDVIGVYNGGVPGKFFPVFPDYASSGWFASFSFRASGALWIYLFDNNANFQGLTTHSGADRYHIGFYVQNATGTYYSQDLLNPGSAPQALTYAGTGANTGAVWECFQNAPYSCLLYTSPSPRDGLLSRMPSSA